MPTLRTALLMALKRKRVSQIVAVPYCLYPSPPALAIEPDEKLRLSDNNRNFLLLA